MGFEHTLNRIRKMWFERKLNSNRKMGSSVRSTVIEKWGMSVRSTVIEKWGMSIRSNSKFGCVFSHDLNSTKRGRGSRKFQTEAEILGIFSSEVAPKPF